VIPDAPPHRLRPRIPSSRYTPYLAVILLCALSPALPHKMTPNAGWWWAAAANLVLMVLVGWAGAKVPRLSWLSTVAPLLLLPSIQWLRNADGNASSGFTPLIFLPVIWFAFHGRRRDVILAVVGGACVQILPIVFVGAPRYPATTWRGTTLFLIVLAFIGPLVYELVQRIQRTNAALMISEGQFRAAFDDAPMGAILSTPDGRAVVQVNQAICDILGRTPEELIGHDIVEFTHADDIETTQRRQDQMGELRAGTRIEKRYLHKSGRATWVAISFSTIRDADGTPLSVIAQVEDISAKRESDRALLASLETERQAAARLQEMEKARRDMVSGVSHDLRTPITAATGFAELLADAAVGPLNSEQRQMVSTIQRSLDRLAAIVEDLLTISRTDHEIPARFEAVDIGEIIDEAVQAVAVSATTRGHELKYVNELGAAQVNGDPVRLDRAVGNLLSNAIKFTPDDGRISVRAIRDGARAVVEVSDTGIGIAEGDLAQIFDQYFRAQQARNDSIRGTGLGLAIVHAIAEQHSGSIEVASTLGVGSTFTLTLPLATTTPH
jgi:PAS domain S-box-containing protein